MESSGHINLFLMYYYRILEHSWITQTICYTDCLSAICFKLQDFDSQSALLWPQSCVRFHQETPQTVIEAQEIFADWARKQPCRPPLRFHEESNASGSDLADVPNRARCLGERRVGSQLLRYHLMANSFEARSNQKGSKHQ